MSACIECKKRDFNMSDALRDLRKALDQVYRVNATPTTKARAADAKAMLDKRKAEQVAHTAAHEDAT